MAWGCFSWIPCPYKGWHEESRTAMVAMLPLVGTGLGLVTCLIWIAVSMLMPGGAGIAQPILTGAIVTAVYFLMTGFIHLDGFMDVADAVMPRHPKMEERIRILKDPHTGSFAAISMALMFLLFMASASALSAPFGLWQALTFIVIVTTSRTMSAVQVIGCRPMGTSQYVNTEFGSEGSRRRAAPALVILVLVLAAAVVVLLTVGGGHGGIHAEIPAHHAETPMHHGEMPGHHDGMPLLMGGGPIQVAILLIVTAVTALTGLIIGHIDRKALGGMNGDISGHLITSSEMAGMLAAALLMA